MAEEQVVYRKATGNEKRMLVAIRDKWHPELSEFDIGLIFRDKPRVREGRDIAGLAVKASPEVAFLTGLDGWVEVCEEFWDAEDIAWRRYLLDHELRHFTVGKKGLKMLGHEIEDFWDVMERHLKDEAVTGLRGLLD